MRNFNLWYCIPKVVANSRGTTEHIIVFVTPYTVSVTVIMCRTQGVDDFFNRSLFCGLATEQLQTPNPSRKFQIILNPERVTRPAPRPPQFTPVRQSDPQIDPLLSPFPFQSRSQSAAGCLPFQKRRKKFVQQLLVVSFPSGAIFVSATN